MKFSRTVSRSWNRKDFKDYKGDDKIGYLYPSTLLALLNHFFLLNMFGIHSISLKCQAVYEEIIDYIVL